jgi:hypothetical protein
LVTSDTVAVAVHPFGFLSSFNPTKFNVVPFKGNNTLTTSLSGDTNNYNPIGLSTCNFIRVTNTTGAGINLTGLKSPTTPTSQTIFICNVGVTQISLISNSVSSTVGNRFLLGGTKTLQNDEGIMLIYDSISLCWRSQAIQV